LGLSSLTHRLVRKGIAISMSNCSKCNFYSKGRRAVVFLSKSHAKCSVVVD
jgi:hypothetical protein